MAGHPHPILLIMKGELSQYSIRFAIRIVEYYKWLANVKHEYVMSRQILRSGTSIGANIHEAEYGASKADFRNKLKNALKEANETEYWLIVLESTGYFDPAFNDMKAILKSIIKMLISALNSLGDD